ncbi:hypothetical protein JJC03_15595 [Flavobacterium oreochromis]|uniref:hypothetical protein n=1 Tax=Flavobacterium oreochromis TaxID=2906078 RepID=UPI001CE5D27F|nr:hypothetical protein [Flavobacterium oreochromis]QYS86323.1 hypothetical protein JJC03_15595 [Flavobacterium oreochromis]
MSKDFIKVTQSYSTKNRVQELVLNSLIILDHTLSSDIGAAKKMIKKNFNSGVNSYNGRAKLPELREYQPDNNTTTFIVDDVIIIQVYKVSIDFTH